MMQYMIAGYYSIIYMFACSYFQSLICNRVCLIYKNLKYY